MHAGSCMNAQSTLPNHFLVFASFLCPRFEPRRRTEVKERNMCGIAGTVNWGDAESLQTMADLLIHRGPDDAGLWYRPSPRGPRVGLASRRLSILDLSPAGHMPMRTQDGALTLVYNGECYNYPQLRRDLEARGHRFRSTSDTEAVLYAWREWGPDCLRRLNGMFAIALWDEQQQKLYLGRDHFGIKP